MTDTGALPALQEAVLDAEALQALLFDIGNAATLIGVSLKWKTSQNAEEAGLPLARVAELLLEKQLLGVQLRYVHAGREWWDTLLPVPAGTRLVRIEHS